MGEIRMKKVKKSPRQPLLNPALQLAQSGISVIPVAGDSASNEPKKPTIRWRRYQKRIMAEAEVRASFTDEARALGIVCGRVSGLVVIDFDDHLRYQRFCRHRPQLAKSYTVKTRRGYHVYFKTAEKVPTHQFDGGDIKGEGSYVIAPPSCIGGFKYRPINNSVPLSLDRCGIDALLNYFHLAGSAKAVPGRQMHMRDSLDLKALYQRLAGDIGRNNALYRVASAARDQGMKRAVVEQELLELHARQLGSGSHRHESRRERLMEARRSILSAFRKGSSGSMYGNAIPNSVREKLLRVQRSSVVARFLDCLVLEGWREEAFFTLVDAMRLGAKYGLNRKSVMQALTGERSTFNGKHIIARRYAEYLDIGGLKGGKRGRPVELVFQAPSVARLLSVMNVSASPSDALAAADLKSSQSYRLALHREYIRRLTPRLSVKGLADRLGVDARTVRRYNQLLGVKATATVGRFELNWETLQQLPRARRGDAGKATAGYWLETADGCRMPAWRHVGAALLKRGAAAVNLCMRRTSLWSLSPDAPLPVRYERLSTDEFVRLRLMREGGDAGSSLAESMGRLLSRKIPGVEVAL